MGLESLTGTVYIDSLVATNPTSGDTRTEGDDHIRGIKNVLKTTFPNIDGAVTSTQDELNILDGVTATTAELNYLDGVTTGVAGLGDANTFTKLQEWAASTATAANDMVLDGAGNSYIVGGTTTINRMTTINGGLIALVFAGSTTLTAGASAGGGYTGFYLNGAANLSVAISDVVLFAYIGGQYRLIAYSDYTTVPKLLDEDAMTSNSASHAASQQSIKAYTDTRDLVYAPQKYVSGAYTTYSAGTNLTQAAHGLSGVPTITQVWGKCIAAGGDAGYSQNDWVQIDQQRNSSARNNIMIYANTTYVGGRVGTGGMEVYHKTDGTAESMNQGSWEIYLVGVYIPYDP